MNISRRVLQLLTVALLAFTLSATACISNSTSEVNTNTEQTQNRGKFYDMVTDQWYTRSANDGLYPITRVRKLIYEDLMYMTQSELRLMRNEIYARHGYIFSSADLREHFGRQSWYYPTSKNVTLNSVEQYNVNFIKQYEDGVKQVAQAQSKFFDEVTCRWYTSQPNDGLFPITRVRKLIYEDIMYLSPQELRIMRNEIYARHGYIFSSDDLRQYFGRQSWYHPTTKNVTLSSIEQYNANFIKQYE